MWLARYWAVLGFQTLLAFADRDLVAAADEGGDRCSARCWRVTVIAARGHDVLVPREGAGAHPDAGAPPTGVERTEAVDGVMRLAGAAAAHGSASGSHAAVLERCVTRASSFVVLARDGGACIRARGVPARACGSRACATILALAERGRAADGHREGRAAVPAARDDSAGRRHNLAAPLLPAFHRRRRQRRRSASARLLARRRAAARVAASPCSTSDAVAGA